MGMSHYTVIGPYLLLPKATYKVTGQPRTVCPSCAGQPHRTGAFCAECGAALVTQTPVDERRVNLYTMDLEEERWMQANDLQAIVHNHTNPYTITIDSDDENRTIDLATVDRDAALAWFRQECAPIVAWLEEHGHPAPTFHYGVVTSYM